MYITKLPHPVNTLEMPKTLTVKRISLLVYLEVLNPSNIGTSFTNRTSTPIYIQTRQENQGRLLQGAEIIKKKLNNPETATVFNLLYLQENVT